MRNRSARTLLRHELAIVSAAFAVVLRKPIDFFTVAIAIPLLLLVWRAWAGGLPDNIAMAQSAGLGFVVAFTSVAAVVDRCAYHQQDGVLAAFSQRRREGVYFGIVLWVAASAFSLLLSLIVTPGHVAVWAAGTLLGTAFGWLWSCVARAVLARIFLALRRSRTLSRPHSRLPMVWTAFGGAFGFLGAILPISLLAAAIGSLTVAILASIIFGRVDAQAVRFRTMMGEGSANLVWDHVARLLAFLLPFAAGLALGTRWQGGAIVLVVAAMAGAFVAMRVLAYQSFTRRIADWVVTSWIALGAMAGLVAPPLAPLIALWSCIWLVRRARRESWLIR